jgi:hypothetical protein
MLHELPAEKSLLAAFSCLQGDSVSLETGKVIFRSVGLWLSGEEASQGDSNLKVPLDCSPRRGSMRLTR